MRLKELQVKTLCQKVLTTLRNLKVVELKLSDSQVLAKMEEIFIAELRIEDNINREAQALLEKYLQQAGPNIDRQKMFHMIKNQLVKDRKIIL